MGGNAEDVGATSSRQNGQARSRSPRAVWEHASFALFATLSRFGLHEAPNIFGEPVSPLSLDQVT